MIGILLSYDIFMDLMKWNGGLISSDDIVSYVTWRSGNRNPISKVVEKKNVVARLTLKKENDQ